MNKQGFHVAMFVINAVLFVFSAFLVKDVTAAFINIFGCLICLLSMYLTSWTERLCLKMKIKNKLGEEYVDEQ